MIDVQALAGPHSSYVRVCVPLTAAILLRGLESTMHPGDIPGVIHRALAPAADLTTPRLIGVNSAETFGNSIDLTLRGDICEPQRVGMPGLKPWRLTCRHNLPRVKKLYPRLFWRVVLKLRGKGIVLEE